MPEMLRLTLILLIVCLLSAGTLSYTYEQTKGLIRANKDSKAASARVQVPPGASNVREIRELDLSELDASAFDELAPYLSQHQEGKRCIRVYEGVAKDKRSVGYAFEMASKGFSGDIAIMVGVKFEASKLVVVGTKVLGHTETPGLGAEMTTVAYADSLALGDKAIPRFQKQFMGKAAKEILLKKEDSSRGTIDALTAATISSRAFANGLRKGLELMEQHLPHHAETGGSR